MTKAELLKKYRNIRQRALDMVEMNNECVAECMDQGDTAGALNYENFAGMWYGEASLAARIIIDISALNGTCDGECEHCSFRRRVPGDIDRIDCEPRYYCSLVEEI